jgi:hypothetical protein
MKQGTSQVTKFWEWSETCEHIHTLYLRRDAS